jgi:hypothetical protein
VQAGLTQHASAATTGEDKLEKLKRAKKVDEDGESSSDEMWVLVNVAGPTAMVPAFGGVGGGGVTGWSRCDMVGNREGKCDLSRLSLSASLLFRRRSHLRPGTLNSLCSVPDPTSSQRRRSRFRSVTIIPFISQPVRVPRPIQVKNLTLNYLPCLMLLPICFIQRLRCP